MNDATPLRAAVVGFGLAGSAFHAPFLATTPGMSLAAVVARSDESAARVTATYPGTAVVPDIASLGGLDIDLAVVATPNDTHVDVAVALLESGISVVVDKPLATSVEAAEFLAARSRELGVPLTGYLNRRWDGDFRTVRQVVDSGDVGSVHRFEARYERWRPQIKPGWKEVPGAGTGILWDLGPHLIDQALQLMGPVVSVHSEVRTVRSGAVVPDDVFVALEHESGAVSHLWASAVCAALGPHFRVLGDRAAFVKSGMDPQEDLLRAGVVPGGEDWGADDPNLYGQVVAGDAARTVPTLPGDYGAFYRGVAAALREGTAMPVAPEDAIAGLRVIEEVAGR